MGIKVIILGGGDLASGVALRLYRSGIHVIMTELSEPVMVRRLVSFGEAMYRGEFTVEGVTSQRVASIDEIDTVLSKQKIPVIHVHPEILAAELIKTATVVMVDARMRKQSPDFDFHIISLLIGLGPGFIAGVNCHAVIETMRGHMLGRVIWQGEPLSDTGVPEKVHQYDAERVLRSPQNGVIEPVVDIGNRVGAGQLIAMVGEKPVYAPFDGVVRGLVHAGLKVYQGMKIGDVDPRNEPRYCTTVSDKSLAIGGAVLEAILSRKELRTSLWN